MEIIFYIVCAILVVLFIASFFYEPLKRAREAVYAAGFVAVFLFFSFIKKNENKSNYKEELKNNEEKYEENIKDSDPDSINDRGNALLDRLRRRQGGKKG